MNHKNPLDAMDRFVAMLDAPEPSYARVVERQARRRRRRHVAAGAGATTSLAGFVAAMVWVLPIGDPSSDPTSVASSDLVASAPATTEPAALGQEAAPVEFTACNNGMVEAGVTGGGEQIVTIPTPDGEMTLSRGRGYIVPQDMSAVSDPRLDGTWALAWNEDSYGGNQANIVTASLRIETDEGAWQGTDTILRLPGTNDRAQQFQMVMTGEGAYEGLTAVFADGGDIGVADLDGNCPNVRGYILGLGVPEAGTFPES